MKRYTVNLSRARATGRKGRAKKAVSILREELEKKEGDITLSREINQKVWENGAANPPNKVSVKIEAENGSKKAYPAEEKERTSTSSATKESTESEYSDIVSGTIDEAKEAIQDMESPDYDQLMEAEKNGKDRKTLKDWIKAQQE